MTPEQYCQQKAAQSGSSFYYSFLFLPKAQREAITAVYAFCREVDDIVDDCTEDSVATAKLQFWDEELTRIYAGTPTHPVGRALAQVLKQYPLKQLYFKEILQGMQMDLNPTVYESAQDLERYCYHVASTVGLLAVEIFGTTNENTLVYAKELGIAFQLVNIIRDVGEDLRRGRLYLPKEEIELFNVDIDKLEKYEMHEGFLKLMQFQAERARTHYKNALSALPAQDRFSQRAGLMMAEIYFSLLDEIEGCGFDVLNQKIKLTPLRKLWITYRGLRREKRLQRHYLHSLATSSPL